MLPCGEMKPLRYLCQQSEVSLYRPVEAYYNWVQRIPGVYHDVPDEEMKEAVRQEEGSLCLATIRHYRRVLPIAQETPFLRYCAILSYVSFLARR